MKQCARAGGRRPPGAVWPASAARTRPEVAFHLGPSAHSLPLQL